MRLKTIQTLPQPSPLPPAPSFSLSSRSAISFPGSGRCGVLQFSLFRLSSKNDSPFMAIFPFIRRFRLFQCLYTPTSLFLPRCGIFPDDPSLKRRTRFLLNDFDFTILFHIPSLYSFLPRCISILESYRLTRQRSRCTFHLSST